MDNHQADTRWVGTKTTYEYKLEDQNNLQYGNMTRVTYYKGDWANTSFTVDHATKIQFWPSEDATHYLVGLPARQVTLDCTSASCDFANEATGLVAETLNIYDSNTSYNAVPTTGRVSKVRTWVDGTGANKHYSQVDYAYDDGHGNQTGITTHTGYATTSTNPADLGSTTTRTYDSTYYAYMVSETNNRSQQTQTAYNYDLGLPVKVTDPNGAMEGAAYDAFGRMIAVCEPGDWDGTTCNQTTGTTLSITYTDYNGQANPKVPFNILLKQKLDAARFMQSMRYYSGLGELLQTQFLGVQLPDGTQNTVVDYQYDTSGRLTDQTRPYTYSGSAAFQAQTFTLPQGTTTTNYDLLGRVTSIIQADGAAEARTYSLVNDAELGWGLQASITDANNHTTLQLNDAWGRLVRVTPAIGPGVKYIYDPLGQLTDTYYGSAHTQLTYNNAGQKTNMDDPDMGTWNYGYDYAGNLTAQTDAKHQRTCLYYDELNRMIGKNYQDDSSECPSGVPNSYTVSYSYDSTAFGLGIGRRTGMADPTGITTWVFDARGRIVSENKIFQDGAVVFGTYMTTWTYNSADQVVDMTYPSGEILSTSYLDQGLVNTVGNYVTSMKYDASGRVLERNLGNGTKTVLQYNDWNIHGGRLEYLQSGTIDSFSETFTDLQDLTFDYDPVGNIQSILDKWQNAEKTGDQRQCFTYDDLNRLTRATTRADSVHECTNPTDSLPGNYDDSYTYDSATGNLASKTGVGTYGYTDTDHPYAVNELDGNEKYIYDANGNMQSRIAGSDTYKMYYDAENRLISVTKVVGENEEKVADYAYDGDGNRAIAKDYTVSQTDPDKTLYFDNYFEVFIDADFQPSGGEWEAPDCGTGRYCIYLPIVFGPPPLPGQVWKSYYYAGDARVAMQVADHAGGTSGIYYMYSDQLGSTAVTANSDGSWSSTINYKAWGESRWNIGSTQTTYRFTGQRQETSLGGSDGLYFYNSRWYDTNIGRFIQPDTIIPEVSQGTHAWDRYAYVSNNPVNGTDPSGHFAWFVTGAIGGLIGGITGFALYTANVVRSGQQFDGKDAALAAGAGIVAGALIGSGAALIAEGIASLSVGATITSTGVGVTSGGGGYIASNILTNQKFNSTDFAVSSIVGGATGAIGQSWATTWTRAAVLNTSASVVQYEATSLNHSGKLALDGGLALAAGSGLLSTAIAGPWKSTEELTQLHPSNPVSSTYSFDPKSFSSLAGGQVWDMFTHTIVRGFSGALVSNILQAR